MITSSLVVAAQVEVQRVAVEVLVDSVQETIPPAPLAARSTSPLALEGLSSRMAPAATGELQRSRVLDCPSVSVVVAVVDPPRWMAPLVDRVVAVVVTEVLADRAFRVKATPVAVVPVAGSVLV